MVPKSRWLLTLVPLLAQNENLRLRKQSPEELPQMALRVARLLVVLPICEAAILGWKARHRQEILNPIRRLGMGTQLKLARKS